jgi:hypothetical protein
MCARCTMLIGVAQHGCDICEHLQGHFVSVLNIVPQSECPLIWYAEVEGFIFGWLTVTDIEDSAFLGLNVRVFPTVLGFTDGRPCMGWEGFAAMAPSEIKQLIVRGALNEFRKIACL